VCAGLNWHSRVVRSMKAKGHRWVGLRQNEDSCSKVLECSDPLLIVMPKMRSADGKITVPPYDGRCASDLGDKMFINSLDLGLVRASSSRATRLTKLRKQFHKRSLVRLKA